MKKTLDEHLPRADQDRVVAAIRDAEQSTSGQIRVHVEDRCPGEPMERARALFVRLGLTRTRRRNGVLIYVAMGDRKFAILGDEGIHNAVGDAFWHGAAAKMKEFFALGAHGDGLCAAVKAVGEALAAQFPREAGDQNELPDDVTTT